MSAILAEAIRVDDWRGLYGESWGSDLVPDAFSHPAKFSRALIRRIYAHAFEEGWLAPGSAVVDPFGGIAGGALDAMLRGCHWKGCELESRFVELGGQNIALWNERYSRMPGWGTAELRQGDSRQLASVFPRADLCVSSPAYGGNYKSDRTVENRDERRGFRQGKGCFRNSEHYGTTPGNLGSMSATNEGFECAISSPPFIDSLSSGKLSEKMIAELRERGHKPSASGMAAIYGGAGGQLGGMKEGSFDAAISSPPYEASRVTAAQSSDVDISAIPETLDSYGIATVNRTKSEIQDFWQASRSILEQLHSIITPGGHAVFVTKRFIRKKQIVNFSEQWAALCEAVGFRQIHHHRCWLVEHHGTQSALIGEDKVMQTERKSFFRRLAEQKGSPRIDYEDVLCFERADY